MKKIVFTTFILCTASHLLCAQIKVINASLINPDSSNAFVGVENMFDIVNVGKQPYTLKANSSSIQSTQKFNSFIVKPHSAGIDTFEIIKNGKTVYSKVFTLSYLPPPEVALGAITKNTASKEEIIANKGLFVRAYNFKRWGETVILTFTLKIKSNNIKEADETITINGNLLSEKAIAVIRTLMHDDVITFDNIKARGVDSRTISFRPFSITIK